ncbi:hypothetical protein [Selenomonas sp. AE3005]|uniref:hypothetical protein n=1 Tax=Selenomonas sp. AE3005 TaxID=1485543 RepID=UPI0025FD109E|nr:hypothetical protein [Selenomonas sp. AE3005]
MKLKLSKTVSYNNVDYKELEFDFEGLTGFDLMKATEKLNVKGMRNMVPYLSMEYHVAVAAAAAKVDTDVIGRMAAPDFVQATMAAQNFLLGTSLGATQM